MDALLGITFKDWIRLIKQNKITPAPGYIGRSLMLLFFSFNNSTYKKKEEKVYGPRYENVEIQPPIFILGHWRSGTTLLHSLLALDKHFAYPNTFQISYPHTCLYREMGMREYMKRIKDASFKRPMDNIEVQFDSPAEDENAIAIMGLKSPILTWTFPKNEAFYARYHTFKDAPKEDFEAWKNALIKFYKKLTWRYKRPLILKSPVHTARVKILLDLFPDAKFIHIYRNPFRVFQSTRFLYHSLIPLASLQKPPVDQFDSAIIRNYKTIYDAYLEEKKLIPEGRLVEIPFETFVKDKMAGLKKIYDELSIPHFDEIQPKFEDYLNSISGYKKNEHQPIPHNVKEQLKKEWAKFFDAFGYPMKDFDD